jgi:hypothetical protein
MFSLIKDSYNFFHATSTEFMGFGMDAVGWPVGEEWQEESKPIKATFKMLPVMKQILNYLPIVSDETAKDWGIRINSNKDILR